MLKVKAGTIMPTDAEDEAIRRGIAADPDTFDPWDKQSDIPEQTEADFARAEPMRKVMPDVLATLMRWAVSAK